MMMTIHFEMSLLSFFFSFFGFKLEENQLEARES
jgi:hypothetical protein